MPKDISHKGDMNFPSAHPVGRSKEGLMALLACLSMGWPLPSSDAMPTVGERRLISLRVGNTTKNRLEGIE